MAATAPPIKPGVRVRTRPHVGTPPPEVAMGRKMVTSVDVYPEFDPNDPTHVAMTAASQFVKEASYPAGTDEDSLPREHQRMLADNYALWGEVPVDLSRGMPVPAVDDDAVAKSLDEMGKDDLMREAKRAGIEVKTRMTRNQIIHELREKGYNPLPANQEVIA